MRKIKKALFQENAASVFLFETGIIIITVAVLLIWRSDLFGYFFWQDKIRSGHPASSCISILHDYFFPGALGCVEKEKSKIFQSGY